MEITLNVLNHLGINLYSNVPAVLSEVVANAWDADATEVSILVEPNTREIIIQDNGFGMTRQDINQKYLAVGYQKRKHGENTTPSGRSVMGRKGIGKLSLFSIAKVIEVYSAKDGDKSAFRMKTEDIQRQITNKSKDPYRPESLNTSSIDFDKGTRIILRQIKKGIHQTPRALRKRLARRFSIIGKQNSFNVSINKKPISVEDRDYFHKIEYLWYYGDDSRHYAEKAKNAEHKVKRPNKIEGEKYEIKGWLGLVKDSGSLQDREADENLNKITLLMRGKVAKEDMLEEFREGGLYTKYLFGEITADFLDLEGEPDIATSSRQDIVEDDDRYQALKRFLQEELKFISKERARYKRESGVRSAIESQAIEQWYEELSPKDRKRAKKLFGKINQITTEKEEKKQLFSHSVLAFESLRHKRALDALEKVTLGNLNDFLRLFKEFDEIEALLYHRITKERLAVIDKLREQTESEDALEKVLQEHLFKYLWLLEPSWDRATDMVMEKSIKTTFENIENRLSEEEKRGRVDIRYKTPAGKHVIIELKRASRRIKYTDLLDQVDKYRRALRKALEEHGKGKPQIEVICVVGGALVGWDDPEKRQEDIEAMAAKGTRVVTYKELITNAYSAYGAYIEENEKSRKLLDLLRKIEEEIDGEDSL